MAEKRAPSVRARQLASELRRMREAATMTGDEAAKRLGWSGSKISRIETGQTAVTLADLQLMLDIYGVSGSQRSRLEQLGQRAAQRGWWDAYVDTLGPHYAALIALEAEAESVRWFAPIIVPGLLQTEDYARGIIRSALLIAPPGEVERRVQVRMNRQRVLAKDDPLRLNVIVDEAALLRPFGSPEVMRNQLRHLTEVGELPNVDLQVLPLAAGAHPATSGEFMILSFPEPAAPDVVYLENMISDLYFERETDVYRYILAFDALQMLTLDAEESAALIATHADTIG